MNCDGSVTTPNIYANLQLDASLAMNANPASTYTKGRSIWSSTLKSYRHIFRFYRINISEHVSVYDHLALKLIYTIYTKFEVDTAS